MSDEPVCDFCSKRNPSRTFECPDFPMDKTPGLPEYRSKGAWMACSKCGTMIDNGRWDDLVERAARKLAGKYALSANLLRATVKRSHDLFRQHYRREKVDVPKKIEDDLRDPKTGTFFYELTPERKEQLVKVCNEVIDLLTKRTSGPMEAMVVLHMVNGSLEEVYGTNVTGSFTIPMNEAKH